MSERMKEIKAFIKKDQPEVIMVSWEYKGNQRKVFTDGDLVEITK